MNKKKTIAVAIVLTLILLIGGMLAYFTDTDNATNEFTLGDEIDISLTEQWNADDGKGLHPGATVVKAPSIKNESTTTPAYVFAEVIVPCYASTGTTVDTPLFTFLNSSDAAGINSGWTLISTSPIDTTAKTITYVYVYGTDSAMTTLAKSATTAAPVFNKVVLAPTLTAAQKATASEEPNIVINAYGIQIDNLGTTSPTAIYNIVNPAN